MGKDRSRKASLEAISVIQVRDDGGLDHEGSHGGGGKQTDSRYGLKVELIELTELIEFPTISILQLSF